MNKLFLVTDIVGSTRLWEHHPEAMRSALSVHDELVRSGIEQHCGKVFKTQGDAFFAVFEQLESALAAARSFQTALAHQAWPENIAISVRTVIHCGVAEERDGDFFGAPLNRCARMLSVCHGGQVLVSEAAAQTVGAGVAALQFISLGSPRLKDLSRPEPIFQLRVEGLEHEFPKIVGLESTRNNLPVQLSSFVGRESEIRSLIQLCRSERLVTLTGMGGSGKTRLALQLSAELFDLFPEGICFVSLEAVAEKEAITEVVAASLAAVLQTSAEPWDRPIETIREKKLLLIFDNCEQVLEPCAEHISELLKSCPGVSVLATSRERLHITGEQVWKVPPLKLDGSEGSGQSEASTLFIERAQAIMPELVRGEQSVHEVQEIVRQLEGLPLLIELASARVAVMSLAEIGSRLKHRIRLLANESSSVPLRQRTFQATMDWSYEGLSDSQKALLRRLSVFAGGWDLEAAESVVGELTEDETVDEMSALVEKSLIVPYEDSRGKRRFRYLGPVREYARQMLESLCEDSPAIARHHNYYQVLAEEGHSQLVGSLQGEWIQRFAEELPNFNAALAWAVRPVERIRLSYHLARFWFFSGRLREGRGWLENAIRGYKGRDEWRAKALGAVGSIARAQGDLGSAQTFFEEAYEIWEEVGDKSWIASALNNLALTAQSRHELSSAKALLKRSAQAFAEAGETQRQGVALTNLMGIALEEEDFESAAAYAPDAVKLLEQAGDKATLAMALYNWWTLLRRWKRQNTRPELLVRSIETAIEVDNKQCICLCLLGVAELACEAQEFEPSVEILVGMSRISSECDIKISDSDETEVNRIWSDIRRKIGDDALETAKCAADSKELRAIIRTAVEVVKSR